MLRVAPCSFRKDEDRLALSTHLTGGRVKGGEGGGTVGTVNENCV